MYLSHSRTALNLIIQHIKNNHNYKNQLLVPDYICNTITEHLKDLDIEIIYYKINKNLVIDFSNLNKLVHKKTIGLLIVHYFGFPINLDKALKFCEISNLVLIEDNSHGYKGYYKGKELGTFGKFGFAAPRKHLQIKYGGFLNSKLDSNVLKSLKSKYKCNTYDKFKFIINNNFLSTKLFIQKYTSNKVNKIQYEPYQRIIDSKLDKFSLKTIQKTNWANLRKNKMRNYIRWKNFFSKYESINLFENFELDYFDVNPWCYPLIFNSEKEVINILNWAKKNLFIAFCWPTLPNAIKNNTLAYKYSRKIVCFSTYKAPGKNFKKSIVL